MDTIKTVKELAEIMKDSGLSYIKFKNDDFEIEMDANKAPIPPMIPAMATSAPMQSVTVQAAPAKEAIKEISGNVVKSPIVGTFYAAPAPGKAPYSTVGQSVNKGDVLFIIESMKLMNEVTSEYSGKITEILVKDGEAVEFDQPIMIIE